ncbi:MAG TPA: aminoacyl--tRNA ligase-related protein [Candidatus Paceibacterota bacterium]|nr:aminoacyl--tRNA ligase-related protein [Candidatus Paceibacterota bacterium]
MKFSQLFTKTLKNAPADETAVNAQFLIRGGFIHKEMAGVYDYLPLGFRVIEKIKQIVREEMNDIGGQEFLMSSLQRKELWEKTDRWDDQKVDIWFKSELKSGTPVGLGWSHEEPISDLMTNFIDSYRDLPICVYQFQAKLRNELRAKSGIMRGREFLMKDMYSYNLSPEAHESFYQKAIEAYHRVFERIGLGDKTFLTFASGGAFTQFSHEFQTLTEAGEDVVYLHRDKKLAINKEVLTDEVLEQLDVKRSELEEVRAAEVGNIFSFGSVKSEQLGLYFRDENGERRPVILGSYGIGISRLMGVLVEVSHDDKGIIWPEAVAPFAVHLISLGKNEEADAVYQKLESAGVEVLYDDREDKSAGEKFADADLIGCPVRLVISAKMATDEIEIKHRTEKEPKVIKRSDLTQSFQMIEQE